MMYIQIDTAFDAIYGGPMQRQPRGRTASVILTNQQWAALDGLAAQYGVSRADVFRWAVTDYLERLRSGATAPPGRPPVGEVTEVPA
jgi:hypothetical protein